jgi:hypothetical protein
VPSAVVTESSYPLTIDPTVSGPYLATDENSANRPSVAFDGTNYLVVWSQIFGGDNDILGARLRANGSFLSGPFLISSSDKSEIYPDVAWNGSSFLVAWQLMFNTSGGDWDITGQRVSAAGGLLGGNFVINGTGPSNQQLPSVASDGSGFLVAWQDDRSAPANPMDIRGTWVSSTGTVDFSRPTLQISTNPKFEDRADVAWNGSAFLVVWELLYAVGDWDVYGRLVSPGVAGTPLGSPIPISTPTTVQSNPAVASNGADFLVAWDDNRNGGFDIFGARLNASGGVVDTSGFPISVATRYQGDPSVAYNGAYLVAWIDERRGASAYDLYAARVANDRTVQDPNGFRVATGSPATLQHYVVTRGSGSQWGISYLFTGSGGSDASVRLNLVSPK